MYVEEHVNYRISNIPGHFLDSLAQDAALTKLTRISEADPYQFYQ